MKFYTLGPDNKFGYPQIDGFGGTINNELDDSFLNEYDRWTIKAHGNTFDDFYPPNPPNLNFLKLSKRAYRSRPTDLLSGHISFSRGMIISERFRDLLQNFKLPEHIYYDVFVEHSSGILPYYYLYFPSTLFKKELVDFSKSSFYTVLRKTGRFSNENLTFKNWQEFIIHFEKYYRDLDALVYLIKDLYLLTKNYDFFGLSGFNRRLFVSANILEQIKSKKYLNIATGVLPYKGEIFMTNN